MQSSSRHTPRAPAPAKETHRVACTPDESVSLQAVAGTCSFHFTMQVMVTDRPSFVTCFGRVQITPQAGSLTAD